MFDIGWTEILIIAVVAIIVVGPKDLPGMLRTLGRYAGQLKRTAGEFRSQFDEAIRDSELDELRSTVSDMGDLNPVNQIKDSVNESLNPLKETAEEIKGSVESVKSGGASSSSSSESSSDESAKSDAPPPEKTEKAKKKPAPEQKAKAAASTADSEA